MTHSWNMTTAALAITAATALAGGAQAATLFDFTDSNVWSGSELSATTSDTIGGLTVDLSSNPADSLNFTAFDGPLNADNGEFCQSKGGPLACDNDGVGVQDGGDNDDEISGIDPDATPPDQSITVEFSAPVNVLDIHFLDLFFLPGDDPEPEDQERAIIYANGDRGNEVSFIAVEGFATDGGYGFFANPFGNLNISSLTFTADFGNDGQGDPDYALAAISVSQIPLPAAGWLLLAGIGGLGAFRRFRKT